MAAVGLELLYSCVQNQLKSQHDALMCCLHSQMVANGFKNIGVGDSPPADASTIKATELLPGGWNENQDVYNLLYRDNKNGVYTVKCLKMDNVLLVHIMRCSDEVVCSFSLEADNFVSSELGAYDSTFKNMERLAKIFQDEVAEKLFATKSKKQKDNQKMKAADDRSRRDSDDPLRASAPRRPQPDWGGINDPFSLGRRDLDPLAAGHGSGGGMVMDPFHGGFPGGPGRIDPNSGLPGPRLPRGAVPPGARFDPFGPPDPDAPFGGRRSGPDPDHMRPPDFDDMFM